MEGAIDSLESELGRRSEELRAREADAGRLEFELQETRSRLSQARRQTDAIRDELTATHERADGQLESLAVVGRQLDELRAGGSRAGDADPTPRTSGGRDLEAFAPPTSRLRRG